MKAATVNRGLVLFLTLLMLLSLFTSSPRPVKAQTSVITIVSYRVDGAPNYNAPGNESFWKNIGWTNVSLAASVSPGGGKTPYVLVKSANDGFNVYVLFRWSDPQGPSFGSSTEEFLEKGNPVTLYYQNTTFVTQLYYTPTYYYPDRVAMLWFLRGPTRGATPVMKLNSTGAITNGTANIWHWQSVPTDNNPADTSYAGNYTDPRGKTVFPPNNSSFSEDDFTNQTGFFPIAGSISGTPNLDPYANPFIVLAGNYFSAANKTWTVEMVRPLIVQQDQKYRVQLQVGSSYYVGFAVWNGKMGESAHIKSVSEWYNFNVSNQAPSSPPSPSPTASTGGISLTLAAATGAGLLIVGVVIGFLVKPEKKRGA